MSSLTTCPACGYTRKPSDDAPDWECPQCYKAYNKTARLVQRQDTESQPARREEFTSSAPEGEKISYTGIMVATLAYWGWESRAAGNIRIDLLLIYPFLFFYYLRVLWPRFRWFSAVISLCLMALNLIFFVLSYSLFHKNVG